MEGKGAEPMWPSGSKGGSRATEVKDDVFLFSRWKPEIPEGTRQPQPLSWAAVPPAGARGAEEGADEGPEGPEALLGPAMENGGLGAGRGGGGMVYYKLHIQCKHAKSSFH